MRSNRESKIDILSGTEIQQAEEVLESELGKQVSLRK